MDGASSVIAIVSLAIQVVDSSQKLFEIWKTIRGAPADIQRLMLEIESLKVTISQSYGEEEVQQFQHAEPGLGRALHECKGQLSRLRAKLDSLAVDLTSSNARKRTRGVVKAVFMKPEIEAMKRSLEEAKSTLTIAKMNLLQLSSNSLVHGQELILRKLQEMSSYHQVSYSTIESPLAGFSTRYELPYPQTIRDHSLQFTHNSQMAELRKGRHFAESPVVIFRESTGTSAGMIITPFGSVRSVSRIVKITTTYPHESHISTERHHSYIIHPFGFLALFGISSGLCLDYHYRGAPQYSLRPFNAVPATSAVFRFCEDGNLSALKTLFACGDASVRDMDPFGRTPLWVALHSLQSEVAEFLFQSGTSTHLSTGWCCNGFAPIQRMSWDDPRKVERQLSIFYLLQKYCPQEYDESTTLVILEHLSLHYRPQKSPEILPMRQKDRRQMTQQRMMQLLPLLPLDNEVFQSQLLHHMIFWFYEQEVLAWTIRNIEGHLSEGDQHKTFSGANLNILLMAMFKKLPFRDPESMKLLVQKAKALHRV